MGLSRAPSLSAGTILVLGLALLSTVLAHGDDEHEQHNGTSDHMDDPQDDYPPSYFSHPDHAGLMYGHISFMVIAWVFVLPVAVMLSLVRSRYTLASQFIFIAVNALGILLGTIYNAQTPDLYPGNAHHSIGWIVTWVTAAHVLVSLMGRVAGAVNTSYRGSIQEQHRFIPVSTDTRGDHGHHQFTPGYRLSDDSGQGSEPASESFRGNSVSTHVGDEEEDISLTLSRQSKEYGGDGLDLESMPFSNLRRRSALAQKLAKAISGRLWKYVTVGYKIVDRIILPLGFVAVTTGVVTYARFFDGHGIFNGLAHWIKGGVFFWLGLFNLGRWTGSFAELGWAWNIRPKQSRRKWRPSAEFVESALIFVYGSTNIFLEHLGNWGGQWTSSDLEHISITVLFMGGGLCGMLIESTWIRELLNTNISDISATDSYSDLEKEQLRPPTTYEFSLNPIPALVILLLGIMMGSHHQQTMTSTMVHKQWGDLLLGASFARGLTYVVMYIRPPRSILPSRPPTELLTAFGLISGGIIFMASSKDTVDGMIHQDLEAMFIYTVTMGLVGILMAWVVTVLWVGLFAKSVGLGDFTWPKPAEGMWRALLISRFHVFPSPLVSNTRLTIPKKKGW